MSKYTATVQLRLSWIQKCTKHFKYSSFKRVDKSQILPEVFQFQNSESQRSWLM